MSINNFEVAVNELVRHVHYPFEEVKKCWLFMKSDDLPLPKEICAKIRMAMVTKSYHDLPFIITKEGRKFYVIRDSVMLVDKGNNTVRFHGHDMSALYEFVEDAFRLREKSEVDLVSRVAINTSMVVDGTMLEMEFNSEYNLQFFLSEDMLLNRNVSLNEWQIAKTMHNFTSANINLRDIAMKIKRRGFVDPVYAIKFSDKMYIPCDRCTRISMVATHSRDRKYFNILWIYRMDDGTMSYKLGRKAKGLDELVAIVMPIIELVI